MVLPVPADPETRAGPALGVLLTSWPCDGHVRILYRLVPSKPLMYRVASSILGPFAAVQSLRESRWFLFRARLNRFHSLVLSRFKHLLQALLLDIAGLQFPGNDCRQGLHCLWEEVADGRLQWLVKDSRRPGAHLPGVHQCPPARALPIGSQTPAKSSPIDGHKGSAPARRREDGSKAARRRHDAALGLDLRDDARRSSRPG